jgi:hypothetical protein
MKPGTARHLLRQFAKDGHAAVVGRHRDRHAVPDLTTRPDQTGRAAGQLGQATGETLRARQRKGGLRTEQRLPPDGTAAPTPAPGADLGGRHRGSPRVRTGQPTPGAPARLSESGPGGSGQPPTAPSAGC